MNPLLIALLAGLGAGAGGGWFITDAVLSAEIAQIKTAQAEAEAAAEKQYRERFAAEQQRGDGLSAQLAQAETQLTQRTLEVSRAVTKVTTGKRCLDSAAVRLLNRSAADHDSAVPQAAEPPAAESTAIATDTDVAGWIGGAQYQYDICRARLDGLIDFEKGRPDDRPQ